MHHLAKRALAASAALSLIALGYFAYRHLVPQRKVLHQSNAIATPTQLESHCQHAIGQPRVEQITDNIFVAIGYDLANTILIKTSAGNVVVDVSMSPKRAREVRQALLAKAPGKTLAIIYTHSHIDHIGGATEWIEPDTEIWATDAFLDHFVKQYGEFRVAESRRGAAQFGAHVELESLPCSAIGRKADVTAAGEVGMRMPNKTFSDKTSFEIGGVTIELVEAHGETHDQLFVWLPQSKTLLPGDNYYHAFPNLYTIRGTSPRPIDAWIESLDEMRKRQPDNLVPSHTIPLRGQAIIADSLTRYRDAIQWVRDRTIQGANAGLSVDTLAQTIGLPPSLKDDTALAPMYGQIDWSVRAIYTNHLGWFDERPETLYPLPQKEKATKLITQLGGLDKVWSLIDADIEKDPRWATELLALLRDSNQVDQSPQSRWANTMAKALENTAKTVGNTNGRGYLLEYASRLHNGPSDVVKPSNTEAMIDSIPLRVFFRVMASRLIPELSQNVIESAQFDFEDTKETYTITIRNSIAEVAKGTPPAGGPKPFATIKTTAPIWRRIATDTLSPANAIANGSLKVEGDIAAFYTFSKRFQRGILHPSATQYTTSARTINHHTLN